MNKFLILFFSVFLANIAFAGDDQPWRCHEARIRFFKQILNTTEIEDMLEKCKEQTASLKKKSQEDPSSNSSDQFGIRHSEK